MQTYWGKEETTSNIKIEDFTLKRTGVHHNAAVAVISNPSLRPAMVLML
jgi:hypothetical protein